MSRIPSRDDRASYLISSKEGRKRGKMSHKAKKKAKGKTKKGKRGGR